ncbi:quinon protein alcohol dehydrogenase-like superfamily [Suillus americanus]|nr:quinon protein alcohol dehydrogenase-like superfamily [Suillus americanus]
MPKLIANTTPIRTFEAVGWSTKTAVAVFPNKRRMVTGSEDHTLRLWDLETGVVLKKMEGHGGRVLALAVSQDGQIIASGDFNGEIIAWHGETGESLTQPIKAHHKYIFSVDFSPDGAVLATASDDITLRLWDLETGVQVGHPWEGHTNEINAIAMHPSGTLVASASADNNVRLWRLSDQRTVAIFKHSSLLTSVTFSADGKHIFSGGLFEKTSVWQIPKRASFTQILAITTARNACVTGDLDTAQELLTQAIHTNANDHTSYAHRSFVMAQKHAWDLALDDAIKVSYTDLSWPPH